MIRRFVIAAVALSVVCVALVAGPAGARARAATQGVTKDSVNVVVVVADVDKLRTLGITLPARLTTAYQEERWTSYFKAIGKVNGRTINATRVTYDPADPTSYDKACIAATQDNKPFVILNTSFRAASTGCVTVDNQTPMWNYDGTTEELLAASEGRLIALSPPAKVAGSSTITAAVKAGVLKKGSKIAILSANDPAMKSAGDAAEAQAKKSGIQVVQKTELNTVGADLPTNQRDAIASVSAMTAAGAEAVIITPPFGFTSAFFNEVQKAQANFTMLLVEVNTPQCSVSASSRVPTSLTEMKAYCATSQDTKAVPAMNAIKPDTKFEAQCRAEYNASNGRKAWPASPIGDIKDSTGATLDEDFPAECALAHMFADALKAAGKNPTYPKVLAAVEKMKDVPLVYASDGKGSFGKNKYYGADSIHFMQIRPANATTPKDPTTGLYNGCPAPVACFIPVVSADGQEWFSVTSKG